MILADGYILTERGAVRGHAVSESGRVEILEGPCEGTPDVRGVIVPSLVNAHTHCADAGVKPQPGMTLEELVAPPDGLKHRYLRETPRDILVRDMADFERRSKANGIGTFVDFREGGAEGCRMAREACPSAVILGRPVSPEYDYNEVEEILSVADGIALPSLSDMDFGYIEKVAEQTHRAGKAFAMHVSERVREDIDAVLSLEPAFVVHMVEATDPDLRKCVDADVPIAVCPRSNRFFGKVPPLARMVETGNTVALGTDNAMLCSPDLRPEALLANSILGNTPASRAWTWGCLHTCGKLLYRTPRLSASRYREESYSVLPMSGQAPESAWTSDGPAIPL